MPALLLRFLPHIIAAVAIVGAVWWFSNARYQAGVEATTAAYEARLVEAATKGREDVERAKDEAKRQQDERDRQQAELERKARDEDHRRLEESHKASAEWERRYRKAVATDQSCAKWSAEPVLCPL